MEEGSFGQLIGLKKEQRLRVNHLRKSVRRTPEQHPDLRTSEIGRICKSSQSAGWYVGDAKPMRMALPNAYKSVLRPLY
jgi:hypothetical protein